MDVTRSDLLGGAAAGLLATIPQTVAMQAVRLALPGPRGRFPPRQVTEAVVARAFGRVRWSEFAWWTATAASHLGFGAAAGAAYPAVGRPGRGRGLVYGLAVGLVSYGLVMPAFGIHTPHSDRPLRKCLQLFAAHLAWGLAVPVLFDRIVKMHDPAGTRRTVRTTHEG